MSAQPTSKPKSDALHIAPPPNPPCDRFDSCPHGDVLHEMRDDLHELKDAIVGTVDKPGLGERLRTLEKHKRTQAYWQRTALGAVIVAVLSAAGTWIWGKLTGKPS